MDSVAPASTSPSDAPTKGAGFAGLGLSEGALRDIAAAGFENPTPVQRQALPPALSGRDLIAVAATGTGKTAAFVLPIVERLAGRKGTRALILAPTRELVTQITEVVRLFGARRGVRVVQIVGGLGMEPQVRGLQERREVVVATPGRLIDHIERGSAQLDGIEVLVLDEADRMLDMGFKPQMDRILRRVPAQRQTMLLSATMGQEVARFAKACLRDPVRVETTPSGTVAPRAEQRVFHVAQQAKMALLLALLSEDDASTLVFTRTKHRAEKLAKALTRFGYRVTRIHGDRSQSQRQAALEEFRNGRARILVATDVAARGLDVEEIGHVVNFDLSMVADDHVHRVGRTARNGSSGRASSFCSPEETGLLRDIEKFTRTTITRAPLPVGMEALPAPTPAPAVVGANPARPPMHGNGPRHGSSHRGRGAPAFRSGGPARRGPARRWS